MRVSVSVALLAMALPALVHAQEAPKVAVLDFAANGTSEQLASAANGLVANELQRMGMFKVSTSEMVRSLIAHDRQMQLLGCSEERCFSGITNALGVEYLVTGKVSKIPGSRDMPTTYTLELALLNAKKGTREGSDVQTGVSESDLTGKIPRAVAKLVQKVLSARGGSLIVDVGEPGATVKVDDVVVGTSPIGGRFPVPAGPHFIIVEKTGFVTAQKEIKVLPNELAQHSVVLVPSPDFIRDYQARSGAMRMGAWIASGLGVAGLAAGGFFQVRASAIYGSADQPGTFAYERSKLLAGIEVEGDVDHRFLAQSLGDQVNRAELFSYIGFGAGVAAGLAAAYFWIAGEDPGRYDKFRQVDVKKPAPKASLFIAPTAGGAYASLGVQF
ncbi:MAG TPA: PEGA domain-containing protein [Myxococcaceae bacterium]|nr:PEGA domain-containing protein [Myxococcaceae bacterium]